ncbi:MAG: hypothetical protein AB7P67_02680 [Vicinamibacterales bacterium]
MSCEELDAIEALDPVNYEDERPGETDIHDAVCRARRQAAAIRLAVLVVACGLALGLAQPRTLEAIGVVAHSGR